MTRVESALQEYIYSKTHSAREIAEKHGVTIEELSAAYVAYQAKVYSNGA
jgi:hypothetical protein